MEKTNFIVYNQQIISEQTPIITANNRGFCYGDGFFETMKIINGKIILKELHFERLFKSLESFKFKQPKNFNATFLEETIINLTTKNIHLKAARVRINVFRDNGNLFHIENEYPNYIIQTMPLDNTHQQLNKDGLCIDIFNDAKKNQDNFSSIKSNNYLPYVMAAFYIKEKKLDDVLLLNHQHHIVETSIANIWIVSNGIILTPALSEGCIDGVMRKYLLNCLQQEGIPFKETTLTINDIQSAQEIFLTNAIVGIKWIKQCGKNNFTTQLATFLFNKFIQPLWQ